MYTLSMCCGYSFTHCKHVSLSVEKSTTTHMTGFAVNAFVVIAVYNHIVAFTCVHAQL